MLDTPERRRAIVDMLWDLAFRRIEGPDNQGGPVDPDEVWKQFKDQLAQVGLELTVVAADGSERVIPAAELDEILEEAGAGGRAN